MPPSLLWTEASKLGQLFTKAGFVEASHNVVSHAPKSKKNTTVAMHPQVQPQQGDGSQSTDSKEQLQRRQSLTSISNDSGLPLPMTLPSEFANKTHQERLELFVAWLAEQINADTVYLADEEGLPLASFRASDEDAAFAALLQQHVSDSYQWLSSREQPLHLSLESVMLRVDHMFYLVLMWAKGFEQDIVLGFSVPYRPELKMLQATQSTLYAIIREPGSKE